MTAAEATRRRFAEVFASEAAGVARAPGRVNLIGEHTDYNDGFVLPMAIERGLTVAFAPRGDRRLRAHAVRFHKTVEADLDALGPTGRARWMDYVAAMAWAIERTGLHVAGADLLIDSDLSMAAGLSSSAALEMACARALCEASGIAWQPAPMARLGQRAENEFVGVPCGPMDQLASAVCREGRALLIDCRTLETRDVVLHETAVVVVMDTGTPRALAGTAYRERRASCDAAVRAVRQLAPHVGALRDVDEALLERARHRMDAITYRRALHVVRENGRPQRLAEAFAAGDLLAAGRLMDESHESLRDLYEVSSPELDRVTVMARAHPACFGARLTGAGFGGCAIALVRAEKAPGFVAEIEPAYRSTVNPRGSFFPTRPSAGAHIAA